jgi:hypothetical protein
MTTLTYADSPMRFDARRVSDNPGLPPAAQAGSEKKKRTLVTRDSAKAFKPNLANTKLRTSFGWRLPTTRSPRRRGAGPIQGSSGRAPWTAYRLFRTPQDDWLATGDKTISHFQSTFRASRRAVARIRWELLIHFRCAAARASPRAADQRQGRPASGGYVPRFSRWPAPRATRCLPSRALTVPYLER